LCVNVLGPAHEALARLFGGKTPQDERFAAASWLPLLTSSPALADALVSIDCRIPKTVEIGTHDIVLGEVVDIRIGGSHECLMYFERRFHPLPMVGISRKLGC
jgi:flavin reductase